MKSETEYDLFVKVNEQDIREAISTIKSKSWQPWDPVDAFDISQIEKNAAILLAKYEKLKNNPGLPGRQWKRALITAIIILTIGLVSNIYFEAQEPIFIALIFAFGVLFIPWLYYRKLTIDIVKIQLAEKLGWYYDPDRYEEKWYKLLERFPELFTKSGKRPSIEDQFWGTIKKNVEIPFYSGILYFKTTTKRATRREAGRHSTRFSSERNFHRHFFCFNINRQLKSKLYVQPYPIGEKQLQENPEQIPFMKAFRFDFKGETGQEAEALARSLSGEVQKKLLTLRSDVKNFRILFTGDAVMFMIDGDMFQKVHTNLFKGIEIDHRDEELLKGRLLTLFEIANDIVNHMEMKEETRGKM